MESFKIEHLTFAYPNENTKALNDIEIAFTKGEFITVCGKSGCGKSTLLRHLKPSLTPYGTSSGKIFFEAVPLAELGFKKQSETIGFVQQSPDNQIVCDKVWHELAFGLESLGISTPEIRARVAEMASYFGIQNWFHKSTAELSGGQKQLLNLASVMAMQPSALILDEPTAQLDPIAAQGFLNTLSKINKELGTTIIISEHRLEDALPLSDNAVVMENGKIIACGTPSEVGSILKKNGCDIFDAFPTAMRVYAETKSNSACPVAVSDGRRWLKSMLHNNLPNTHPKPKPKAPDTIGKPVVSLSHVWFRYEKKLPDVIKDLSVKIYKGEFYAIVGGNATGKTTALSLICGIYKPYRGKKISDSKAVAMLPQNPQTLFVSKTVRLDLYEMLENKKISDTEKKSLVDNIIHLCELENLLDRHPYDLSGGEQQRAALAKVLLNSPDVLLLDEPTKGLDAYFKKKLAKILCSLKNSGVTIIAVSHDIEFCAEYADRCAMFFDGSIVSEEPPESFFSGKNFYTTHANLMARELIPNAILAKDIINAVNKNKSSEKD